MNKYVDIALRIAAWSLMLFGLLIIILKGLGIIHSPTSELLTGLITAGIFLELGRLESRVGLLWSEFKKRKKI